MSPPSFSYFVSLTTITNSGAVASRFESPGNKKQGEKLSGFV